MAEWMLHLYTKQNKLGYVAKQDDWETNKEKQNQKLLCVTILLWMVQGAT